MDKQPKIEDWQDLAHSIEVLAASAHARSETEADAAAAPLPVDPLADNWQHLAHSVEVLTASAQASEQLRAESAKPALRLVGSGSKWGGRAAAGLSRIRSMDRSAQGMLAAAVVLVAVLGTLHFEAGSGGGTGDRVADGTKRNEMQVASAEIRAEAGRVAQSLRCRSDLDCWSGGGTTVRSLGDGGARITTGSAAAHQDIEARAARGTLPAVDIPFDAGSPSLTARARASLDAVALALPGIDGARGASSFAIIGLATSDESNAQELSEQRARAVADYLIQAGAIERRQIDVFGRGSSPADATASSAPAQGPRVRIVNLGQVEAAGPSSAPAQCEQYLPGVNRTVSTPCK